MKRIASIVLALIMVLSLTACGAKPNTDTPDATTPDAPTDKVYTLKLSGTVNEDHLVTKTERYFIEQVETLSEGRLKIEFYPNNQLGDPRSMLEATTMGNNDIVECGLPQYANFTNQLKFFSLPFLFDNRNAAYAFMDTEQGKAISKAVEEEVGVHILGFIDDGYFNPTSNFEIRTPADVKGYKLRCQESDVLLQIWNDLGASPLPMSFSEVYTALQQGAIDGQMNGYITPYNAGYAEVQDYCIKLGLLFDVCPLAINADTYYSLPEDLQAVLDEAGRNMQTWCTDLAREENLRCMNGLIEDGMTIIDLTDAETQAIWKEAAQPTYDWFRSSFADVDLDAILKTVAELNEEYAEFTADEVK